MRTARIRRQGIEPGSAGGKSGTMVKKTLPQMWDEYQRAIQYNQGIGLYETVRRNENFYIGKQWEGVRAGSLEKPVYNILRRVVSYFVSQIVSDDIGVSIEAYSEAEAESAQILEREIERMMEDTKFKAKNRCVVRDAAVDGDGCLYFWFDPEAETGGDARGAVRCEIVENRNLMYGNPYSDELQEQPYLLIAMRRTVESAREEARANGISEREAAQITADGDQTGEEQDADANLVTVAVKLWKERGPDGRKTVRAAKFCEKAYIKKEWDTGLTLYPAAVFSWERVKNSYHGAAAMTAQIPNQIAINKLFAMAQQSVKLMAFPKIFYDKTKIGTWTNKLDDAIGVAGTPDTAIFTGFRAPDMSAQVVQMIEKNIEYTRDTMGASDAALGNIKPDNTSAIIAVQKASAAPLELQRLAFWQFVEDGVRIMADMAAAYYGVRVLRDGEDPAQSGAEFAMGGADMAAGTQQTAGPRFFDFGTLQGANLRMKVDVGTASYWSELTQIQTLDNLFAKGIIPDPLTYLESVPDAYVKNKNKLVKALREQQKLQEQQAVMQAQTQMEKQLPEDVMNALTPEERKIAEQRPELMQEALKNSAAAG